MIEIEGLEELQEMLQAGSEELADMQRKIDELDAQITATRNQIGEQDRLIAQQARSLEERRARLVLCQVTQPLRHSSLPVARN